MHKETGVRLSLYCPVSFSIRGTTSMQGYCDVEAIFHMAILNSYLLFLILEEQPLCAQTDRVGRKRTRPLGKGDSLSPPDLPSIWQMIKCTHIQTHSHKLWLSMRSSKVQLLSPSSRNLWILVQRAQMLQNNRCKKIIGEQRQTMHTELRFC